MIPEKFKKRYEGLVDDPEQFFCSLETILPKSFRVNTLKARAEDVERKFSGYGFQVKRMGWYSDAYSSDNPEIGATLEHFLGHIYIQELVSMIPPLIIRKELENADLVLDCAAAPGSKTTQLAAFMENRGTIVANDLSYQRIKALQFNLQKVGAMNTLITNQDLRVFPSMQFDAILLDAPCSSEGIMRKNEKLFRTWNEKEIRGHSKLQKAMILKAYELLRPGARMVYSTCTFAPEENEEVIDHLLNNTDATIRKVAIPDFRHAQGITEWEGKEYSSEVEKCARIFPHFNDTGGFFIAMVEK